MSPPGCLRNHHGIGPRGRPRTSSPPGPPARNSFLTRRSSRTTRPCDKRLKICACEQGGTHLALRFHLLAVRQREWEPDVPRVCETACGPGPGTGPWRVGRSDSTRPAISMRSYYPARKLGPPKRQSIVGTEARVLTWHAAREHRNYTTTMSRAFHEDQITQMRIYDS